METQIFEIKWETIPSLCGIESVPHSWQNRILRHPPGDKRIQSHVAYTILKYALAPYGLFELAVDTQGKPYFPQAPNLHMSLSHTNQGALVAIASHPVGVDIEQIRPIKPHTMERVAQTQDVDAFFAVWVEREATSKCTGYGMSHLGQPRGAFTGVYTPLELCQGYQGGLAQSVDHPYTMHTILPEMLKTTCCN